MQLETPTSKSKQIQNLLYLFFFSLISACALAFFFVYTHGPSGQYIVKSILLEPNFLETQGQSKFVFDKIIFTYRDQKGTWHEMQVDRSKYQELYQKIEKEKSVVNAKSNPLFTADQPNVLTIYLSNNSAHPSPHLFQRVQFLENDFRVELHDQNGADQWAYFHHPNINQEVLELLIL